MLEEAAINYVTLCYQTQERLRGNTKKKGEIQNKEAKNDDKIDERNIEKYFNI